MAFSALTLLGIWKSIQPVKIEWWDVDMVVCLVQGVDCSLTVQLMPLHPKTPSSHASFKSRLVLPFWYRLTQVVLLGGCSNSYVNAVKQTCWFYQQHWLQSIAMVMWVGYLLYEVRLTQNECQVCQVQCSFHKVSLIQIIFVLKALLQSKHSQN